MMRGKGYDAHIEGTNVNIMRASILACYGPTVTELYLRVVEMEVLFITDIAISIERRDSEGVGPHVMFAQPKPQTPHYDALSGTQWAFIAWLNASMDTALGDKPCVDIVQLYQKAMELDTAEERSPIIAAAMITLERELKMFKEQPARLLPEGSFVAMRMAVNIHKGRGGLGRKLLFGNMKIPPRYPQGQGPESCQVFPAIIETSEFSYSRETCALDPIGVANVLTTLRASYETNAWRQNWPTVAEVMNSLKVPAHNTRTNETEHTPMTETTDEKRNKHREMDIRRHSWRLHADGFDTLPTPMRATTRLPRRRANRSRALRPPLGQTTTRIPRRRA
jgi:hypothetical protein